MRARERWWPYGTGRYRHQGESEAVKKSHESTPWSPHAPRVVHLISGDLRGSNDDSVVRGHRDASEPERLTANATRARQSAPKARENRIDKILHTPQIRVQMKKRLRPSDLQLQMQLNARHEADYSTLFMLTTASPPPAAIVSPFASFLCQILPLLPQKLFVAFKYLSLWYLSIGPSCVCNSGSGLIYRVLLRNTRIHGTQQSLLAHIDESHRDGQHSKHHPQRQRGDVQASQQAEERPEDDHDDVEGRACHVKILYVLIVS